MKRISRVLCAVDLAEPGRAAFDQALALARAQGAELLIVHGVPLDRPFDQGAAERVTYLRSLVASAEAADVDVRVSVQSGEAAEIVLLHAHARESGLIVLSAQHGRINGRAFGSVAEDVLRGAGCPTLIVPGQRQAFPSRGFANALCAVDLSATTETLVQRVTSLIDQPEHRLMLLHVIRGSVPAGGSSTLDFLAKEYHGRVRDTLRRLQELIPAERKGTVLARVAMGEVVPEIVQAARASHADVIIVAARPRTRVGRRLFGVTRELLRRAECPVLAIPAGAPALSQPEVRRKAA